MYWRGWDGGDGRKGEGGMIENEGELRMGWGDWRQGESEMLAMAGE